MLTRMAICEDAERDGSAHLLKAKRPRLRPFLLDMCIATLRVNLTVNTQCHDLSACKVTRVREAHLAQKHVLQVSRSVVQNVVSSGTDNYSGAQIGLSARHVLEVHSLRTGVPGAVSWSGLTNNKGTRRCLCYRNRSLEQTNERVSACWARRLRPTCTFCVHEVASNNAQRVETKLVTCPCRPCRPSHPYRRHRPCRRQLIRLSALQQSWPQW